MLNTADPVTCWALVMLVSVMTGTFLLITVAFIRRWSHIRYARNLHALRRHYRPLLASILAGIDNPRATEELRELSLYELELLLDPLFAKRKLTARHWGFLKTLCAELGLIELWQKRAALGRPSASGLTGSTRTAEGAERAVLRHMLRAKSIRNLGKLRHRPSWPLLLEAADDRRADIQWVALGSLAAIAAPESFPALCQRLPAAIQGASPSLPLPGLRTALVAFDLTCAPALLPFLVHPDRRLRSQAADILRTMVSREAARNPGLTLTPELLPPALVERLLTGLAVDTSAEIRGHAAEVIAFLDDPRATSVMRELLADRQWIVRLRAVHTMSGRRGATRCLPLDVRECLRDSHHGVRESAIQTLIALGPEGQRTLYEHFLTSTDQGLRHLIVEVLERTGLMSALVEEYSAGTRGVGALLVEQLAGDTVPLGLSGVLRTLRPEVRQKFLDRFLPLTGSQMRFLEALNFHGEGSTHLRQSAELPPSLAA